MFMKQFNFCIQLQNAIPQLIIWIKGSENLRAAAIDYQNHINEYHREMHFEALVEFVAKR